ncbi:MAG: U32 family peptidase [Clostridia bacterium]|nr:U32 family peptidase [Clostridia bacterium]
MRRNSDLPELLAPAGSEEALYAAVRAGADAVYLGGKAFGARAFAANFDGEGLKRAVAYCHLHGVRLYVTVNTLVYERELPAWLDFCRSLYAMGVDALIVTDLGGISLLRRYLPHMELHASTQMGLHNSEGVRLAAELGLSRAVVARECSLSDMREMVEKAPLELEVFLHGALCVCHSGQCLFSSLVGGRSGNRGECAQPCRLPYGNGGYPLSLKDLSLARHITELLDAGVSSLKIEGRMKSPDYVYGVTRIYRRLLDEKRNATDAEERELSALFSRSGFTDGYFTGRLSGMTGVRSEQQKEESRALSKGDFTPMRLSVSAEAVFRSGEPCRLTLKAPHKTVTVQGEIPAPALRAPLSEDELRERLCKMGNTYLSLSVEDLSITLSEGINLSPAAVNALRRAAALAMESSERESPPTEEISLQRPEAQSPIKTAVFHMPEVLFSLSETEREAFDIIFVPLLYYTEAPAVSGVSLPPVIMERELGDVRERLSAAAKRGARYALISNLSHFALCREAGLIPVGDFRMNLYNCEAAAVVHRLGAAHALCSLELTVPRAASVGGVLVYGRAPLMLTERCFVRENAGCSACGSFAFTDRRGMRFPVLREYMHRNLIFNSVPTYMGDKQEELGRRGLLHRHFIFSDESAAEIKRIVAAYDAQQPLSVQVRRIGVSEARIYDGAAEPPAPKKDSPRPMAKKAEKERPMERKGTSFSHGGHPKTKLKNGKKSK